ncbi:GlxA family transcriptional regulator [Psychromonas aquimarina]|uniref:GlxA family transcriptional regulator n=1 Tax=Psychromonas aquimarina TaxID=444919 RepID=UPI000490F735|nr:helix-turn-helix domain-containing protein [Psychromonas aquimarina]
MKQVVILASEHCLFSSVGGPMDIFLQAGRLWNGIVGETPSPYFDVKIVTLDGQSVMATNQVVITPHCSVDEIENTDLILIPSQGFNFRNQDDAFFKKVHWLKKCYERGADLASMCTGAFTLAATGLLDGKSATTHWGVAEEFKKAFPKVILRTDLMVTDEGRLFCSGGVTADLNLSLFLINKYCGKEVALQTSRCTLIDLGRIAQQPFTMFIPEKNHLDAQILKVQEWMEDNFNHNLANETLAQKVDMSTRNFNRRFKAATGTTVVNYVQLLRTEKAKKELEDGRKSFDEISYNVGYENVSFFRRLFKKHTGLSPKEYQQKFFRFVEA